MVNIQLTPRPVLGGYHLERDGIALTEIVGLEIVSVACRVEEKNAVNDCLRASFGVDWPEVGLHSMSDDASIRVLGLQQDQAFVVMENDSRLLELTNALTNVAWCTQQSDSWVSVQISGERLHDVLERTCPLDLAPSAFTENQVARTSMEHLSTILYRQNDSFILMSPSSSARGFLHMLEESIRFID